MLLDICKHYASEVHWFSKKHSKVEISVFGSEFVAVKQGIDITRGLRYKLTMMCIPISVSSFINEDNVSVVHNSSRPETVLKKKSNSVCFHTVYESGTMGSPCFDIVPAKNVTDQMIIVLGQIRRYFVSTILYDIHDDQKVVVIVSP